MSSRIKCKMSWWIANSLSQDLTVRTGQMMQRGRRLFQGCHEGFWILDFGGLNSKIVPPFLRGVRGDLFKISRAWRLKPQLHKQNLRTYALAPPPPPPPGGVKFVSPLDLALFRLREHGPPHP